MTSKRKKSQKRIILSNQSFYRLKCVIADNINPEFGQHYRNKISADDIYIWTYLMNRIIERNKLSRIKADKRVLEFLLEPADQGMLTYGTCKKILALLYREADCDIYGYTQDDTEGCTMKDIKTLLKECCDTHQYLLWTTEDIPFVTQNNTTE